MEVAAVYGSESVRPRLTVVKDGGIDGPFSALPHAVIRRTDIPPAARLLVAVIQMYGWKDGECLASHATLAADVGCSTRMLRTYLDALIGAQIVTEHDAGARRQKVYRLVSIGSTVPIETFNEKQASDSEEFNRKFPTVQSEMSDTFNRKQASDSKKKKQEEDTEEDTAPTEPVRVATRSGQLLDWLKAADVPVTMRPQDHRALKDSGADPSLVAEAYGALFRGEWGDDFMRRSISVQFVIGRLAAYQSWLANPRPAQQQRNGSGFPPAGAASKQMSSWAGRKNRYGSNLVAKGPDDGR